MRITEIISGIFEDDQDEQQKNSTEIPVGSFMANSQANVGYPEQQGAGPAQQAPTPGQQANAQTATPSIGTIPPGRGTQKSAPLLT